MPLTRSRIVGVFLVLVAVFMTSHHGKAQTEADEGRLVTLNMNCSTWFRRVISASEVYVLDLSNHSQSCDGDFVLLQVHSFSVPVRLSNFVDFADSEWTVNGTDVGLVGSLRHRRRRLLWYLSALENRNASFSVLFKAMPYSSSFPVPGGCSLEFDLEIAPQIAVKIIDDVMLEVTFQRAGWIKDGNGLRLVLGGILVCFCFFVNVVVVTFFYNWKLETMDNCDRPHGFTYCVFMKSLPVRDLTLATNFDVIEKMSDVDQLPSNGVRLLTIDRKDKTRFFLPNVKMHGTLFVVVATSQVTGASSAYVPAVNYGCDITEEGSCKIRYEASTFVLLPVLLLAGFVSTFLGHRFFRLHIALYSFLCSGFLALLVIGFLTNLSVKRTVQLSAGVGMLGALFMLWLWWYKGYPFPCVFAATLVLGYLISSAIFSTPISEKLPDRDGAYTLVFGLVAFSPIILMYWTRPVNIFASSFCGAYIALASLDLVLDSTDLSIVVWQSILRQVFPKSTPLLLRHQPLTTPNIVLICAWMLLAVGGFAFQWRRERGNPPFPPHRNLTKSVVEGRLESDHPTPAAASAPRPPGGLVDVGVGERAPLRRCVSGPSFRVTSPRYRGWIRRPIVRNNQSPLPFLHAPLGQGHHYGAIDTEEGRRQVQAHWPPIPVAALSSTQT